MACLSQKLSSKIHLDGVHWGLFYIKLACICFNGVCISKWQLGKTIRIHKLNTGLWTRPQYCCEYLFFVWDDHKNVDKIYINICVFFFSKSLQHFIKCLRIERQQHSLTLRNWNWKFLQSTWNFHNRKTLTNTHNFFLICVFVVLRIRELI